MKTLIKIALGFLLLVSAAAATGNWNCENVNICQDATGNCITGDVNLAQITDASSFVLGSDNSVDQCMGLSADDNCLTGVGEQSNLCQRGDLTANATGCYNDLEQGVDFSAYENCLTDSNMTQWGMQAGDAVGSCNDISQYAAADACDNCLTMSDQKQISDFEVCATGDSNCVDQCLYQEASDNCLTTSCLWQQTAKVVDILGCDNSVYQDNNLQYADYNCMTGSLLNQVICENAQVTGSCNEVDQGACSAMETDACNNCLTNAGMLQSINSQAVVEGCNNYVNHNVYLDTDCNSLTGGMLTQMSTINSND